MQKTIIELMKINEEKQKESEIQSEILNIKYREERRKLREDAEERLYGNIKTKRVPLTEEEKGIIFGKFNDECVVCGKKEDLNIHHKDKNPSNNRLDNLIVLCGVCHKKIHMKVR